VQVIVWRIAPDTPTYLAHDLSGRGAEKTGGRWNQKGTALIYASTSRALACLETLVHVGGGSSLPLNRYLVKLSFPTEAFQARSIFDVTANVGWDAEPPGKVSIDWGNAWALERASLLAEVPSIVVPEETNILINPAHVDIDKVKAEKLRKWSYDVRLRL
jgi:RES domain-containing protein